MTPSHLVSIYSYGAISVKHTDFLDDAHLTTHGFTKIGGSWEVLIIRESHSPWLRSPSLMETVVLNMVTSHRHCNLAIHFLVDMVIIVHPRRLVDQGLSNLCGIFHPSRDARPVTLLVSNLAPPLLCD